MASAIWQATKFLAAFALVVFLAAAASRFLALRSRGAPGAVFRMIGALGLGGGRSLAAVQVGRRVLVLGLGDRSVSLLATIDDADELNPAGGSAPGTGPRQGLGAFAGLLRASLGRGAGGSVQKAAARALGRVWRRA